MATVGKMTIRFQTIRRKLTIEEELLADQNACILIDGRVILGISEKGEVKGKTTTSGET